MSDTPETQTETVNSSRPFVAPPPVSTAPAGARPVSVTLIGAFFIFAAVVESAGFLPGKSTGLLVTLDVIDSALFVLVKLAVGLGLLRMRSWARVAAIGALVGRFVLGNLLVGLEFYPPLSSGRFSALGVPESFILGSMLLCALLTLVFYTVIIVALTRPGVKAAFAQAARKPSRARR